MSVTSPTPRRHHTDLQPLTTRPDTPIDPTRRKSTQNQGSPPTKSATTLPSPSVVAARAYYLELVSPIGPEENALKRRRSLIQGQQTPRRHSLQPLTGSLVSQLENFTFAASGVSNGHDLRPVPEGDETEGRIKAEDIDVPMTDIKDSPSDIETSKERRPSLLCGSPQDILRQVPFRYTHEHLKDWGYAYLGNSATADAFITAVSLRRPSLGMIKLEDIGAKQKLVTIRARVVPKAKERKPFLIQRQFDIDDLRSSIPRAPAPGTEDYSPTLPRRSSRIRRSSAWQSSEESQRKETRKTPSPERFTTLGHGSVPIHIEYALHYLPVLAALMLSGHVRKGDTIDLPIPHPEAWSDTVTYIYTGRGEVGSATKYNIAYLAGHGD